MKLRKFNRGDNFFFQLLNDENKVTLESQSYTSKTDRDNGVESVKANIKNADRYESITEVGEHYFILKAGNNKEIARSGFYGSQNDLENALSYLQGGTSTEIEYGTDGITDDYRPISFY
jgi:uncharacterized protein YegP (UPF0339 family)